jgi:hypothetical protein
MQLANVAFEDTLLADISGTPTDPKMIIDELVQSGSALLDLMVAMTALQNQMRQEKYGDLPCLKTLPLAQIGEKLATEGVVNLPSWTRVTEIMTKGTFYAVVDHFMSKFMALLLLTGELKETFKGASWAFERGQLNLLLEQNMQGNVKVAFARLYQEWISTLGEFLASSMLSTTLWYAHNGYPDLLHSEATVATHIEEPLEVPA